MVWTVEAFVQKMSSQQHSWDFDFVSKVWEKAWHSSKTFHSILQHVRQSKWLDPLQEIAHLQIVK